MAKATIKSRTGAIITIEGTQKEVSDLLSTIERAASVGRAKVAIARKSAERKEARKRENATDLVVSLQEEGFFDKPKGLSDIAAALEERGYLCPITTLSGVMLGLVQKRLFRRKKSERKWVYGK